MQDHHKKHLSLALKVFLSILLGIVIGLVFGPGASFLKPIGDGYVMLMEAAVLPYIASSLIHGVGSLHKEEAKKILRRCSYFLLILWGIAFVFIYAVALLMPNPPVTIYNAEAQTRILSENFFTYLIPKNPFYDLTNNIVPAIAVFGLIVGISLIFIPQKKELLSLMERIDHAMEKLLLNLAKLAPLSIIAHLSYAFGTIEFKKLFILELYVLSYVAISLFIVFVTLPILLKHSLHVPYSRIFHEGKTIALVAFATGSPSVVLPFIHSAVVKLTADRELPKEESHATIQTVIPIGYTFAQIGNSMILFFLLFLSFFYRQPFLFLEKALISLITIPLSIGAAPIPSNAMNFLIENLKFPKEAIDLFNEATAITDHFQVLCSVVSILVFSLLALFSYFGILKWNKKKLFSELFFSFGILFAVIGIIRLSIPLKDRYKNLYNNLTVQESIRFPVPSILVEDMNHWIMFKQENRKITHLDPLASVMETGILRIGYDPNNIPFCYWNSKNELVGLDIANAYQLAKDLDCRIQFVPIDEKEISLQLDMGYFDLAMSSMIVDEKRLLEMTFTDSYDQQNNILIVPSNKVGDFVNLGDLKKKKNLIIGALSLYQDAVHRHFPSSKYIPVENNEPLIKGEVDAIFSSYQYARVWCLNHSGYSIVDYQGKIGQKFFAYPVKVGEDEWKSFLDSWLYLKESSSFEATQKRYWFEGISPGEESKRRGLLHYLF